MKLSACPSPPALERAFFGDDPSVAQHARSCPRCRESWNQIADLAGLARSIQVPPASSEERESLRTKLISAAQPAPRASRRWAPWTAAAAIALLALVVFAGRSREDRIESRIPTPPVHRGKLRSAAPSRYWWVHPQPDEIVRLVDGSVVVTVDPLTSSERFRVVTGDAEVELRGAMFEVIASDDHLREVRCLSGMVEIRQHGRTEATLNEGDRWRAGESVASALPPRAPEPMVTPDSRRARAIPPEAPQSEAPAEPREDVQAYEAGWAELRSDDFEAAGRSFQRVVERSTDSALEEDAHYFLAVAHGRAGGTARAIETLESFLRHHSSSERAPDATAMLGWLYYESGDGRRASALFEQASKASSLRAARSAQDGLEAIRRDRARTGR